jgi:hypothetical protein
MADPFRFLTTFAQALSTMALYANKHPARERAVDRSFSALRELQVDDPKPQFSFLGEETVYGQLSLRDLREWEWANRLGDAGIQRLEFEPDVTREEYEEFLEQVLARLTLTAIDSAEMRTTRPGSIKFGAIGVRGETNQPVSFASAFLFLRRLWQVDRMGAPPRKDNDHVEGERPRHGLLRHQCLLFFVGERQRRRIGGLAGSHNGRWRRR